MRQLSNSGYRDFPPALDSVQLTQYTMDENPYQAPQEEGGGHPNDDGRGLWAIWPTWVTDLAILLFLAGLVWLFVFGAQQTWHW